MCAYVYHYGYSWVHTLTPSSLYTLAEPAAAEERPPLDRPHPQVSEEQQEGEDKDPPKDKGQPDVPDQKENQL